MTSTETSERIATRATYHEARRHFEAGGTVLVSEYGHELTYRVTSSTTTHNRDEITWDRLSGLVREWRNRYPNQRYYIVPNVDHVAEWTSPNGVTHTIVRGHCATCGKFHPEAVSDADLSAEYDRVAAEALAELARWETEGGSVQ